MAFEIDPGQQAEKTVFYSTLTVIKFVVKTTYDMRVCGEFDVVLVV